MKKKQIEDIPVLLERFFKSFSISGIVNIPGVGTVAMYTDESGKLKVLDHAKIELVYDDILRQKKAEIWAAEKLQKEMKLNDMGKDKIPKYVN